MRLINNMINIRNKYINLFNNWALLFFISQIILLAINFWIVLK